MTQTYLNEETYQALVAALINAAQSPYAVREVLGEIGGVWPDTIKAVVEAA